MTTKQSRNNNYLPIKKFNADREALPKFRSGKVTKEFILSINI